MAMLGRTGAGAAAFGVAFLAILEAVTAQAPAGNPISLSPDAQRAGAPESREQRASNLRRETGGAPVAWKIEVPEEIRKKAKSPGAPLGAELSKPLYHGRSETEWIVAHVLFTLPSAEGHLNYLVEDANRTLTVGPDRAKAKEVHLLLSKKITLPDPQSFALRVLNHATELRGLTLTSPQLAAKFSVRYRRPDQEPFIVACANQCTDREVNEALAAYEAVLGDAGDVRGIEPPGIDRVHVYAFNPQNGALLDLLVGGVAATCDSGQFKPLPIGRDGRTFELSRGAPTFCLILARKDAPGRPDYRCETRPRMGATTQAPVAVSGSGSFVPWSPCPPPPPKLFSVQAVEGRGEASQLVDLKVLDARILGSPVRLGTWEAPAGQEPLSEIRVSDISLQNRDYEAVGPAPVVGTKITIPVRRVQVSFKDLSFLLTDDLDTPERNCDVHLVLPRNAVLDPAVELIGTDVQLPLFERHDQLYQPTTNVKSPTKPSPNSRLLLDKLGEELTLQVAKGSKGCRRAGQEKYPFEKAALLRGAVQIRVALARPSLNLVLWPDKKISEYAGPSDRERVWNLILSAFTQAIAEDPKVDRWRDVRVWMRGNDGALTELGPSAGSLSRELVNSVIEKMTAATDQKAQDVIARFDDTLLSKIARGQPTAPQVVIIAGQTTRQVRFCESAATSLASLKSFDGTTVMFIDLLTRGDELDRMNPINAKAREVFTCKAAAPGAAIGRVQYLGIAVPEAVGGTATAREAAEILVGQLRSTFDLQNRARGEQ